MADRKAVKFLVTYETRLGELKSVEQEIHMLPGHSRQTVVLDIIRNGFRYERERGVFRHVSPNRVVDVEYTE